MKTYTYEKMTNEELKEAQKRINEVLRNRQNEELKEAQQAVRDFIQNYYAKQHISFYLSDGYGGKIYIYTNDIFAER